MELSNIVIVALANLSFITTLWFLRDLINGFAESKSLMLYFQERIKLEPRDNSQRSMLISQNQRALEDQNLEKRSSRSIITAFFKRIFNELHYLFRISTKNQLSPLIINKKEALFLMSLEWSTLFYMVNIFFQTEYYYEEFAKFLAVILIGTAFSSFIFFAQTMILSRTKRQFAFDKVKPSEKKDNSLDRELFILLTMVSFTSMLMVVLFYAIQGRAIDWAVLYFALLAIIAESLIFKMIFCFFFALSKITFIKISGGSLNEFMEKEEINDRLELELRMNNDRFIDQEQVFCSPVANLTLSVDGEVNTFCPSNKKDLILCEKSENIRPVEDDEMRFGAHQRNNQKNTRAKRFPSRNKENLSKDRGSVDGKRVITLNIEVSSVGNKDVESNWSAKTNEGQEERAERPKKKGIFDKCSLFQNLTLPDLPDYNQVSKVERKDNDAKSKFNAEDTFIQRIKENLERGELENVVEFSVEEVGEFEEEGGFHVFRKKIKNLKRKMRKIKELIGEIRGEGEFERRKKAYLEGISKNLAEIAKINDFSANY